MKALVIFIVAILLTSFYYELRFIYQYGNSISYPENTIPIITYQPAASDVMQNDIYIFNTAIQKLSSFKVQDFESTKQKQEILTDYFTKSPFNPNCYKNKDKDIPCPENKIFYFLDTERKKLVITSNSNLNKIDDNEPKTIVDITNRIIRTTRLQEPKPEPNFLAFHISNNNPAEHYIFFNETDNKFTNIEKADNDFILQPEPQIIGLKEKESKEFWLIVLNALAFLAFLAMIRLAIFIEKSILITIILITIILKATSSMTILLLSNANIYVKITSNLIYLLIPFLISKLIDILKNISQTPITAKSFIRLTQPITLILIALIYLIINIALSIPILQYLYLLLLLLLLFIL